MNKYELLLKSTCRITCGNQKGSGFFISSNLILTTRHVIYETVLNEQVEIIITNCGDAEGEYSGKLLDNCELCDFALIEIYDGYINTINLSLCYSDLVKDEHFDAYGYPETYDGVLIGEPLEGTILRTIENSTETIHDVGLDIRGFDAAKQYGGFSGSPMINERCEVVSIIRYENQNYLSGITIRKAKSFLEKNNIVFKLDSLDCFDRYIGEAFSGFEDRKIECEVKAGEIIKKFNPQMILEDKKGDLFYPKKDKNINDIIIYLKTTKNINDQLWKGWIQLLTFVDFLKGNYQAVNHIQITISRTEISKKFGLLKTQKSIETPILLNFYFVENETYSTIVQRFIHGEYTKGNLPNNVCHIFNSHQENFGSKIESVNDIIKSIASPKNSGPSISSASIGVLSIKQLRDKLINSASLQDVTNNLKKLIEDAIS